MSPAVKTTLREVVVLVVGALLGGGLLSYHYTKVENTKVRAYELFKTYKTHGAHLDDFTRYSADMLSRYDKCPKGDKACFDKAATSLMEDMEINVIDPMHEHLLGEYRKFRTCIENGDCHKDTMAGFLCRSRRGIGIINYYDYMRPYLERYKERFGEGHPYAKDDIKYYREELCG